MARHHVHEHLVDFEHAGDYLAEPCTLDDCTRYHVHVFTDDDLEQLAAAIDERYGWQHPDLRTVVVDGVRRAAARVVVPDGRPELPPDDV